MLAPARYKICVAEIYTNFNGKKDCIPVAKFS